MTNSTTVQAIEAQALKLSAAERAELIERLIASVEPPTLSPAWQAEVERRIADMDSGRTQGVPVEEVFARMQAKLRCTDA